MINKFFREDLKTFKPYETEKNTCNIKLDANESFLNFPKELKKELLDSIEKTLFNRYPDPSSEEICRLYGKYAGTNFKNIIAGNGSDELIQIIINAFIGYKDKVMTLSPDFSMYEIYTKLAGGIHIEFELDNNFKLDTTAFIEKANIENVKLVFISNPNNPTGGVIPEKDLLNIIENINSIVVIDEAYYEFYGKTLIDKIDTYENLIILRTCSKALGLAALRLGFLITNEILLSEIKKAKPPFNVNSITQSVAAVILRNPDFIKNNINIILKERDYLYNALRKIKGIKIYDTSANFILVEGNCTHDLKEKALNASISIKSFGSPRLKNCLRITVGSRKENEAFINSICEN